MYSGKDETDSLELSSLLRYQQSVLFRVLIYKFLRHILFVSFLSSTFYLNLSQTQRGRRTSTWDFSFYSIRTKFPLPPHNSFVLGTKKCLRRHWSCWSLQSSSFIWRFPSVLAMKQSAYKLQIDAKRSRNPSKKIYKFRVYWQHNFRNIPLQLNSLFSSAGNGNRNWRKLGNLIENLDFEMLFWNPSGKAALSMACWCSFSLF